MDPEQFSLLIPCNECGKLLPPARRAGVTCGYDRARHRSGTNHIVIR